MTLFFSNLQGKNPALRHLNYSHLQYFWTVAREGSVAKAADVLHLTPQTISGQIKVLEQTIGQPLFERVGRRVELNEAGRHLLHGVRSAMRKLLPSCAPRRNLR